MKALLFIAFWLASFSAAIAQTNPRLPCEGVRPFPEYAQPGKAPNIRVWNKSNSGKQWMPPACIGWAPKDGTLVAIAGQFRYFGNIDSLLSRFGAISNLQGLRYWSVSDNRWLTLITQAWALEGPELSLSRLDFGSAEMRSGRDLYFAETDNRSSQPVIYKMHVVAVSTHLVVTVENVTPMRIFLMTVSSPGDIQSVHFLRQSAPGLWSYYGLGRTGIAVGSLIGLQDASYVNRALALYSHFTGVAVEPVRHWPPP